MLLRGEAAHISSKAVLLEDKLKSSSADLCLA